jgi:hypothetical protein
MSRGGTPALGTRIRKQYPSYDELAIHFGDLEPREYKEKAAELVKSVPEFQHLKASTLKSYWLKYNRPFAEGSELATGDRGGTDEDEDEGGSKENEGDTDDGGKEIDPGPQQNYGQ